MRTGNPVRIGRSIRSALGGVVRRAQPPSAVLTALHVQFMMTALEKNAVSAAMRRHVLVTLRAGLSYVMKMNLVAANVASCVPLPAKPRHQSEGITPEQIGQFVAAVKGDRLYALYLLAIDAGLRQGELLGLYWRDLDLHRGTVRVNMALEEVGGQLRIKEPKTKSSERMVKFSQATGEALGAPECEEGGRPRRAGHPGLLWGAAGTVAP